MDILDDMRVSKLSAKVFSKVNYSLLLLILTMSLQSFWSLWVVIMLQSVDGSDSSQISSKMS